MLAAAGAEILAARGFEKESIVDGIYISDVTIIEPNKRVVFKKLLGRILSFKRGILLRFSARELPATTEEGIFMPKKLYVGNLAYAVTDQHLNELFSGIGTVASVAVISDKFSGQSKGFGFVEMSDDKQAAQAISTLDGTEFMGRNLKVNEAKPRENRSGGGDRNGGGGGRW